MISTLTRLSCGELGCPPMAPRVQPKAKLFLIAALIAFTSDYVSKYWIVQNIELFGRIDVIEGFFAITHVRNPAAAFGLLRDFPEEFRLPFFLGVSVLAALLVFSFYRKLAPGDRLSAIALGLVLGGAAGNTLDRVTRGEVVDFLHFRLWRNFSWPDFNLADSWIVVGVALLFVELLAAESDPEGVATQ
jgi:signal peptidase II